MASDVWAEGRRTSLNAVFANGTCASLANWLRVLRPRGAARIPNFGLGALQKDVKLFRQIELVESFPTSAWLQNRFRHSQERAPSSVDQRSLRSYGSLASCLRVCVPGAPRGMLAKYRISSAILACQTNFSFRNARTDRSRRVVGELAGMTLDAEVEYVDVDQEILSPDAAEQAVFCEKFRTQFSWRAHTSS